MRLPLALLLLPGLLAAQGTRVAGVVRDVDLDTPVPLVELTLVDERERRVAVATSDSLGAFALHAPRRGRYTVAARRVGYEAARTLPFDPTMLGGGALEVMMRRTPALLDTVAVGAAAVPAHLEGFERRRARNLGTFFTREDIARRGDPPLLDLLRASPGVLITGTGRRMQIALSHSPNLRNCQPVLYVDGLRTNRSQDDPDRVSSLLTAISARTVDGTEIYSGVSRVPGEFGSADARCGAIVVWTRQQGGARPPRRVPEDTTG